jgi:hypothetical protein
MVLERGLEAHHRGQRPEAAPTRTGGEIDEVRPVELQRAEAMRRRAPGFRRARILVSHRLGAGVAMSLHQRWTNRPRSSDVPNVETDALPWAP